MRLFALARLAQAAPPLLPGSPSALMLGTVSARAAQASGEPCPRPAGQHRAAAGGLRSHHGVLRVELNVRNHVEADGSTRYCYVMADGTQSPTLRVHPGDELILR